MKIYFAGSIRGGRDDQQIYFDIITDLQKYGMVLTEHVSDKNLSALGEQTVTVQYIYGRDMAWLKECDVVVAEVTTPSLGVGYEIGQGEAFGKPIVCLYREIEGKSLSAMISGHPTFLVYKYKTLDEVRDILKKYFENK